MKSKLCWISFIPFAVAAIVIKVFQNYSIAFNNNANLASYAVVCAVLVMFLINIIFVALDRKTSPAYLLSSNIPVAIFAVLAAALIASKSALTIILDLQNHTYTLFTLALTVFGMLTSICLVTIAFAHIQGRNFFPRMGVLFLSMPIWGGLMLISEFLSNRTVSVYSVNPINLFCYAFAMIYLFKLAMIIATVDGKNPVKSMFLYGFPLAGLGLASGVDTIISIINNGLDYSENVISFAFFALALYIIFFNIEITRKCLTKDEQILQFDLEDFDEEQRAYGANQDNTVVISETGTNDYDYDYSKTVADNEIYVATPDNKDKDNSEFDYSSNSDADDFVIAPDIKENDAIYIEKDKAVNFERGVVSQNSQKKDEETDYDEEHLEKINRLIEDINR